MICKLTNCANLLLVIVIRYHYCNRTEKFSIYPGLCPTIDYSSVPQWIKANTEAHNNLVKSKPLLLSYDFIVVGAGAAGSVIASRLTEDKRVTVLLIEAGGVENATTDTPAAAVSFTFTQTPNTYDWRFITHHSVNGTFVNTFPNGNIILNRGRAMGGSSVINGMAYFRGSPSDYDNWEKLGATDWNWNKVFPK